MEQISKYPTISIIVPSFNQGTFLEKTILSIISQNYPKYELIIIDGGSEDCTIDVINKYKSYIHYWVSEKDNGQSSAVNKGVSIAKGDFIGWQNSDDIYCHNAFWKFAYFYELYPKYDIYYGNYYTIDEFGKTLWSNYLSSPSLFYQKYRGNIMANQATFFSSKIIKKCGMLDTSLQFAMDRELFLRLMIAGANAKYIEEFLGAFRIHGNSKTGIGNRKQWIKEHQYIRRKFDLEKGLIILKLYESLAILKRLVDFLLSKNVINYLRNRMIYSTLRNK